MAPRQDSKPLSAADARALASRRARMDRLNLDLRDLLQKRARLAAEIAAWKASRGIATPDPQRERDMLRRVLDAAPAGFDRVVLRQLFTTILRASRRHATQAARPKQRRRQKS